MATLRHEELFSKVVALCKERMLKRDESAKVSLKKVMEGVKLQHPLTIAVMYASLKLLGVHIIDWFLFSIVLGKGKNGSQVIFCAM